MNDVGATPGMAVPSGERLYRQPDPRTDGAGAVLAGVPAAGGAVALTLSSDHVRYAWGDALFLASTIAGFAAAGAYWFVRRPASLLGPALLATAAAWALAALQSADNSLAFSLAVLADWPVTVVTFFALLAFPSGRLTGRLDSADGVIFAVVALFFLPVLLSPVTTGGHPLAECIVVCPPNALQVGSISPAALVDIDRAASIGAVVAGVLACFELVRRFRAGTRPRRRALFWIVVVGVPYAILYALRQLTAFAIDAPPGVVETVRWSLAAVRLLLPWAFVASLLQAEVFAGAALKQLVAGLESARMRADGNAMSPSPSTTRPCASRSGRRRDAYLGLDGAAVRRDDTAGSWLWIDDQGGAPVAVIVHDPVLDADPELLDAAGTATLISMESGRLERDIRGSRAAPGGRRGGAPSPGARPPGGGRAAAGCAAGEAGARGGCSDGEHERLIAEIGDELDATMDDLRRLAHGIYPTLLRTRVWRAPSARRRAARRFPRR